MMQLSCCNPNAFQLMARQADSLEAPDALLNAAVAIAMHEMPQADLARIDAQLQKFADAVRRRVRAREPKALLAHLHEYLFEELKFIGNNDDYYRAANSYLPVVMAERKGLPISLCLIYKLVGQRLGLRINGVGLPGHFLCSIELPGERMLIDPFGGGRVLTSVEASERVQTRFGSEIQWSEQLLAPVSNLHWLTRILQNLLHVFGMANRYQDVAAMLELQVLLWPRQPHLKRDLALVLARIGMSNAASQWLDIYLRSNPDDPQKSDLIQLLEVLSA